MSEKIYAWLLRLYPSRFREIYGEAALQLFRDRSRHERGFPFVCRLWWDLLTDLAASIPHQYRQVDTVSCRPCAARLPDGVPSFCILEAGSLRPGSALLGAVLSLSLAAASMPISRLASHRPFPIAGIPALNLPTQSRSGPAQAPDPQSIGGALTLDAAERQRVIHAVIRSLKEDYFDPGLAQRMTEALMSHDKAGDYDAAPDGAAFASLLTRQLRAVSQDPHLDVVYSPRRLPERPVGSSAAGMARYRQAMERQDCSFETVRILRHNTGYLKLNSFPDPSVCRSTAVAAMASLNRADALIFDLRDNTGGYPDMVMLIAAYLFDHPEYMYNPRQNTTEQSWTRSPVPENRLADKPVYLLTSSVTASGAEQFCYDLKMLKRAKLIGETTRGAAHSGVFHRLDPHFGIGVPETKPINPFSTRDWEGNGVVPDCRVKAADALETALTFVDSGSRK